MTLTDAQRRNLQRVADRSVRRHYRTEGNVIIGGHAATLWKLERLGLIAEERSEGKNYRPYMVLTDAGRDALK